MYKVWSENSVHQNARLSKYTDTTANNQIYKCTNTLHPLSVDTDTSKRRENTIKLRWSRKAPKVWCHVRCYQKPMLQAINAIEMSSSVAVRHFKPSKETIEKEETRLKHTHNPSTDPPTGQDDHDTISVGHYTDNTPYTRQ